MEELNINDILNYQLGTSYKKEDDKLINSIINLSNKVLNLNELDEKKLIEKAINCCQKRFNNKEYIGEFLYNLLVKKMMV
mgnify:CR=1 FL=1